MAFHVRRQIRDVIAAALVHTPSEVTVIKGPRYPMTEAELPAFLVYSQSPSTETSAIGSMGGPRNRLLERLLNIVIDIIARDNDTIEDLLDSYAAEVETKMDEDIFLVDADGNRLAKNLGLVSSDIQFAALGTGTVEVPIGRLRLTYAVAYHTRTGAPTVAV